MYYFCNISFSVSVSGTFKKQQARLYKKYPSIYTDVDSLVGELLLDPTQGSSLGKGLYKVRIAIKSKGQGKSGGGRVITFVKVIEEKIVLAAIYDKSEVETMTGNELSKLLKNTGI